MKIRQTMAVMLVIALMLSLAGCGTGKQAATATGASSEKAGAKTEATATAQGKKTPSQPTAKPTVEEQEEEAEQIDPSKLERMENLESYHLVQSGSFTDVLTDSTTTKTTMEVEIWDVRDPPASHTIWKTRQGQEPESFFEFIRIGNDSYLKTSDSEEWIAMSSSEEIDYSFGEMAWFTDPTSVMAGESKLIGKENVNGMVTKHYRYSDEQAISSYLGADGVVEEAQADVWVSDELNLVVKYETYWKGSSEDGVIHEWSFQSNVLEVNEPITIEPPEGAAKPGLPDDVPLMEGATEVNTMFGITSFKVSASVAEVVQFYKNSLEAAGWTADEGFGVEIEGMLSYTKDNRSLTLSASDEDGMTSVTLMIVED